MRRTGTEIDWWLLEHIAENDPVSPPLLAGGTDLDQESIKRRLERLRRRELVKVYFSSRPPQWGMTDAGRACLAKGIDTSV